MSKRKKKRSKDHISWKPSDEHYIAVHELGRLQTQLRTSLPFFHKLENFGAMRQHDLATAKLGHEFNAELWMLLKDLTGEE